ncbi:MAG: hypothetical protein ACRDS9_15900 [Pseudonocardiaceae bacterium]
MATRDEVHRLVDVLPEDRVAAIGEVVRAAIEAGMTDEQAHRVAEQLRAQPDSTRLASEPVRTFASAGTLSAEPNLAERVEEILRTEPGTAA